MYWLSVSFSVLYTKEGERARSACMLFRSTYVPQYLPPPPPPPAVDNYIWLYSTYLEGETFFLFYRSLFNPTHLHLAFYGYKLCLFVHEIQRKKAKALQCFSMTPVLLTAILVIALELDLNFCGLMYFHTWLPNCENHKVSSHDNLTANSTVTY